MLLIAWGVKQLVHTSQLLTEVRRPSGFYVNMVIAPVAIQSIPPYGIAQANVSRSLVLTICNDSIA